ncbi:MAG: Ig-like domain-containing protein [Eubacteriales bacterium]|nr:Ig-like domain-containing protein [Eubacteriales bacterium]
MRNSGNRKRMTAWLLTLAMVLSNSSFAALAEEIQSEQVAAEAVQVAAEVPEADLAPAETAQETVPAVEETVQTPAESPAVSEETPAAEESEPEVPAESLPDASMDTAENQTAETVGEIVATDGEAEMSPEETAAADGEAETSSEEILSETPENEGGGELIIGDELIIGEESAPVLLSDAPAEDETENGDSTNGDVYILGYLFANDSGSNEMVQYDSMDIKTELGHEYVSEDGAGSETIENYILEIGEEYDQELLAVTVNGTTIHVESNEKTGGTTIPVIVKIAQGEGDTVEVVRENIFITVSEDGYYAISPTSLLDGEGARVNPGLGEELDLTRYGLAVKHYTTGESASQGTVVTDNVRIRMEADYTDRGWSAAEGTENNLLPVLVRETTDNASFILVAEINTAAEGEEENWQEVARRQYWFGGLDYSAWLDSEWGIDFGDGFFSWIYVGQPQTFTLHTDGLLAEEDYTVEWKCYSYEEYINESRLVESNAAEIISSDNTSITLQGASGYAEESLVLWAAVINKHGRQCTEVELPIGVAEPHYEYQRPLNGPGEDCLLPGDRRDLSMQCDAEGAESPYGDSWEVDITGVRVVESGSWNENGEKNVEDAERIRVNGNQEDGWWIQALDNSFGWATIECTYVRIEDGEEDSVTFDVYINGDVYDLGWEYRHGTNLMTFNDTMEITTGLYHQFMDDNGGRQGEVIENYKLEIAQYEEGGPIYNTNLIDAEITEDGQSLRVTSKQEPGATDIHVIAKVIREDGSEEEVARVSIWVEVSEDGFYAISPVYLTEQTTGERINPALGETLYINQFSPELKICEEGNTEGTAVDLEAANMRLRLLTEELNGWEVQEGQENELIPAVVRTTAGNASVTLVAEQNQAKEGEEENWQEITRRDYQFDELEYWTDIVYSYGDREHSTLYSDAELTLTLTETDGLTLPNSTVNWTVEKYTDESGEPVESWVNGNGSITGVTVAADGSAVFLRADSEAELDFSLRVSAEVVWEGITIDSACADTWVWVRHPEYHYDFPASEPGDNQLLPGWEYHIDASMGCDVWDSNHVDGGWEEVAITNVEITKQGTEWDVNDELIHDENANILTCEGDQESGWTLRAADCGTAVATITYNSAANEGETLQEEIYFFINEDRFILETQYPYDRDQVLVGEGIDVGTQLRHEWKDENGNDQSEMVEAYELRLQTNDEGKFSYDENCVDVTLDSENNSLRIQALDRGNTDIWVEAVILGEENSVCSDYIHINVEESFWAVEPTWLETEDGTMRVNPVIGETLNLNDYGLRVVEYYKDEDGNAQSREVEQGENLRIRLARPEEGGWVDGIWEIADEANELIPTLRRIDAGSTRLRLLVEERETDDEGNPVVNDEGSENWYECCSHNYNFDSLEYWTDIAYGYGSRDCSKVFAGEPLTLSLVPAEDSPLALPEGYTVNWNVRQFDENGETALTYATWEANEDGTLTLSAVPGGDNENVGGWVNVEATVTCQGAEISCTDTNVEIRDQVYDYRWPLSGSGEDVILLGHGTLISETMTCYVENSQYPEGEEVQAEITNVEIERQGTFDENGEEVENQEGDPDRITVERQEGAGWSITANDFGYADVCVTYNPLEGTEAQTYSLRVYISADKYALEWTYPNDNDNMLINSQMLVDTRLYHSWLENVDGNYEFREEQIDDYQLVIDTDEDGNPNYDTDLISAQIVANDSGYLNRLQIDSNENEWETTIWVSACIKNGENPDEGYTQPVFGEGIHVNVCDVYSNIEPVEFTKDGEACNPLLKEEADFNGIGLKTYTYVGGEETMERTDISYRLEYSAEEWSVKAGTENDPIPVLIRETPDNTCVTVIAMLPGEDQEEIARRDYWFSDIWYGLDVIYSYGSRMDEIEENTPAEQITSRVLTDIPLVLSLDTSNLETLSGYEVEWNVHWYDEAGNQVPTDHVTYEIAEDGRSISLSGNADYEGEWADITAVVRYNGKEIGATWTHVMVYRCEHEWKETSRLEATCTEAGQADYICEICGASKTETLEALGHSLTHHEAVAATCTTAGSAAYYGCSRCKKYFSDAAGTKELAASDLTTAALGHSPTYHAAVAATCTTAGNVAYYSCSRCKKYFSDAAGTKELAASSLTTKALGHSMTYHKAVAATCTTAGNVAYYSCSRCKKYFSDAAGTKALAASSLTVAAAGHRWGAWTTTAAATVFAPQKQVRRCSGCGLSESRNYGSKLKATVTLTASSLVMKTKQTTAAFKASGFAKGDYLQSVVSSNTKILRVTNVNRNGTFKLTAQKTAGSANLTIRLASGLTKIVKVTVQKKNVKTTAIGGVAKSLKLAKGKTATLKPVLSPVTSQDKITYSTSNKKVATVSSKGVIKGIKAGTARITVKSGSKKFVCTVTVPATKTTNITGVKASVTLKKGKKLTLKPKLTPSNSDEKITYATSNKKVATVTSKGVIKGVKKGTAVITVKSGSKRVTCKVTVK